MKTNEAEYPDYEAEEMIKGYIDMAEINLSLCEEFFELENEVAYRYEKLAESEKNC